MDLTVLKPQAHCVVIQACAMVTIVGIRFYSVLFNLDVFTTIVFPQISPNR
jgi:hypothetical protein